MFRLFSTWLLISGALLVTEASSRGADGPPNLVFLLADDLGWSDTVPYGSTFYETPHIQRLAKRGMTFVNAYSASPLCSPTRASILTGQYPGRLRLTTPACHLPQEVLDPQVPDKAGPKHHVIMPGTRTRLPNDYLTTAEVLRQAGYRTAFMGKWHLGRAPYLPEHQGFDVVVGGRHHPGPPGGYFAPWPIDTIVKSPEGAHIDDVITTEAIKFVEANHQRPFFLNLWFYSVHAPFEAKENLIEKYRAKAKADPNNRQTNPVMGAMIETLDENVGRLLDALERLGLSDNTLVIFTSDNGGNMYNFVEGIEATNNAPLRNGKGNIYEGGQRVPLIASWPGRIAAGTTSHALVSSVDFFPTLLDVAGQVRPQHQVCDGVSIWPVLQGAEADETRAIFCHFPHMPPATGSLPCTSVRQGDWKLLRFYGDGLHQADRLELYQLREDVGEAHNRAEIQADLASQLNSLVEQHLEDTRSLVPRKNPAYQESALGWSGSKDTQVTRRSGVLHIRSKGNDPWLQTDDFPRVQGSVSVEFRMKSNGSGNGAVYVATHKNPHYSRERMTRFDMLHDGQFRTYRVNLQLDSRLARLRFDPGQAAGEIDVDRIRLIHWTAPGAGRVVRHWSF